MRATSWIYNAARALAMTAPLMLAAIPAQADGIIGGHVYHTATPDIRVPLDQAVAVTLGAPAGGVAVGNPGIAGVSVQNERMLFITGRSYGSTNLLVVDGNGHTLYSGRVTVTTDETDAVMVTRGTQTARLECTPNCRPRPDIGDSTDSFSAANGQITTHASTAASH